MLLCMFFFLKGYVFVIVDIISVKSLNPYNTFVFIITQIFHNLAHIHFHLTLLTTLYFYSTFILYFALNHFFLSLSYLACSLPYFLFLTISLK